MPFSLEAIEQEFGRWDEDKRPQKKEARELALGMYDIDISRPQLTYIKTKPLKVTNGIWLPGSESKCVLKALECRKLSLSHGRQIFVERDKATAEEINKTLMTKRWKHKPILHTGNLCNLELTEDIDFAFFDFLKLIDQ